jgi:hypothetical protein
MASTGLAPAVWFVVVSGLLCSRLPKSVVTATFTSMPTPPGPLVQACCLQPDATVRRAAQIINWPRRRDGYSVHHSCICTGGKLAPCRLRASMTPTPSWPLPSFSKSVPHRHSHTLCGRYYCRAPHSFCSTRGAASVLAAAASHQIVTLGSESNLNGMNLEAITPLLASYCQHRLSTNAGSMATRQLW